MLEISIFNILINFSYIMDIPLRLTGEDGDGVIDDNAPFLDTTDNHFINETKQPCIKVLETKPIDSKIHEEFHTLFKSIPADEELVENYSCALSRDILIQGRIWVGRNHLCFYSNILGWVTSVVIAWKEVVGLERRSTAIIFPNAIQVLTISHNRYLFPSFLYREHAYFLMMETWTQSLLSESCSASIFEFSNSDQSVESDNISINDRCLSNNINSSGISSTIGSVKEQPKTSENNDDDLEIKSASKLCGCNDHLGSLTFSQLFPHLGVQKLASLLFNGDFMRKFYSSIAYKNITLFQWSNSDGTLLTCNNVFNGNGDGDGDSVFLEEGSYRRFSVSVPFPLIMLEEQCANVTITERIIKNDGMVFVFESDHLIMGIPGGPSRIRLRWCVSPDSIKRKNVSLLNVTGEAEAPAASWFKESIKKSLLAQTETMLESLGIALSEEEISFDLKPFIDRVLLFLKNAKSLIEREERRIGDVVKSCTKKICDPKGNLFLILSFLAPLLILIMVIVTLRPRPKKDDFMEHIDGLNRKFDLLLQDFI